MNENTLEWIARIDNKQFQMDMKKLQQDVQATGGKINQTVGDVVKTNTTLLGGLTKAAAAFFTVTAAKNFISQMVKVRGEFQQIGIAMTTMLGSKERADRLMNQLVKTAATTPFGLTEVTQGAKQLLAYGTAAEDVNDTLKRLGNIASGLSIPLGDLIYLYGTTQTQGRLFTQDVRQFMGRGIPLVQELAKSMGKTTDEVNAMVSAGKIGFPEVQKVIENMTNQGGMFFNLMEKQSQTLTGQISNLGDSFDQMLNEIGKSSEGVLSKSIELTADLVNNYKPILATLGEIVITYGAYKAALIATTVMQKESNILHAIGAVRVKAMVVQQNALNKVMSLNPYALLIAGITALTGAIYYQNKEIVTATSLQKEYNKRLDDSAQNIAGEKAQIDQLLETAKNEKLSKEQRIAALTKLNKISPEYFGNLTLEKNGLLSAAEASKKYTAALYAQAQMKAKTDQIQENAKKRQNLQSKIDNNDFGFFENITSYDRWFGGGLNASADDRQKLAAQKEIEELDKQDAELRKSLQEQMENVIPKTEKELTNWIARKQEEQKKVGRFTKKYRELQKQINEGMNKLSKGEFTVTPDRDSNGIIQNKAYWDAQLTEAQDQFDALDAIGQKSDEGVKLAAKIKQAQTRIASYTIKGAQKANNTSTDDLEKFAEKKKDILDRINDAEQAYLTKSMSQNEAEIYSTKLKYAEIIKMIEDYNRVVPKDKQIGTGTITRVKNAAEREVGGIKYGQETNQLKTDLEKRKELLQQYQAWKEEFGQESADRQFGNDLESYKESLQKEIQLAKSSEDYKTNYLKQARVKMLTGLLKAQQQLEADSARQILQNALEGTKTTEERIMAIKKKYQKETEALKKDGSLTADRKSLLDKNQQNEINQVYNDLLNQQDKIGQAADRIAGVTKAQIQAQIASLQNYLVEAANLTQQQRDHLQEVIQSLSMKMTTATDTPNQGQNSNNVSGFAEMQALDLQLKNTRKEIIATQESIEKLKVNGVIPPDAAEAAATLDGKIKELNVSLAELSRNKLRAMINAFNGLLDTVEGIGQGFEGINDNIAQAIETIATLGKGAVDSFGGIKSALDSFKDIKEGGGLSGLFKTGAADGGGLFGGITAILGKAGPIAMGISTAIKGVTSVIAMGKKVREANAKARAEIKDWYADAERGELEYQALLRKRSLDNITRGKTTYQGLLDEIEETKKQFPAVQKAYDKLFQKLQGEEFISGKGYKHGTLFRKTKTWDIMASLYGSSYDELEKKYSKGLLKDGAKADFESLQKLREEMDALGVDAEEAKAQLSQMLTGLDTDSFSDKIMDVIKQGSQAFGQLGNTIEDIIRNSVLNGFKYQVLEPMIQPFLDELAQHMMDGTATEQYLENWKQSALNTVNGLMPSLDSTLDWLNTAFPGSDGKGQQSGLTGQIKSITQGQASELAGLYRNELDQTKGILSQVKLSNQYLAQSMDCLKNIETNTYNTVQELKASNGYLVKAVGNLESIKMNTRGQSTRDLVI